MHKRKWTHKEEPPDLPDKDDYTQQISETFNLKFNRPWLCWCWSHSAHSITLSSSRVYSVIFLSFLLATAFAILSSPATTVHSVTSANHPDVVPMTSFNLSALSISTTPLPTIVVQLRGELGNHMSAMAHGYGLQLYALEFFGLETQLLLRHQVMSDGITSNPKWISTSRTLQRCFEFSDWDFSQGSRWEEFNSRKVQQEKWLDFLELKLMSSVNGRRMKGLVFDDNQPVTTEDIHKGLESFVGALTKQDNHKPITASSASVSLPFLFSESIDNTVLVDRYWKYFQSFFALDLSCCGDEEPYPDESVFHFRNFATEMPNYKGTLQEATPNQTAFELFGHLRTGDKVAITSRFNNERLELYVNALRARQINVRVIEGQSGIQDFCFLTKAKQELVGNFQSTFVFWAAILGNAKKAVLYTVDSPSLKQRFGSTRKDRFQYKWNSDSLRDRVILKLMEYDSNS